MNNRYRPTLYLIDNSGRIRDRMIGEVRPGGGKAGKPEARIPILSSETV